MNYKELLESGEPIYKENDRFKYFKNPVTSERYFSNYLSYKVMPTVDELKVDLAYIADEQANYASDFAFLFFAEKEEFSDVLRKELEEQGFEFSKHLVFTNSVDQLQLPPRDLGAIKIVELTEEHLETYIQMKYQGNLEYGQVYANQMKADHEETLLSNSSKVYLALEGDKIIGDVTAWFFGAYVEVDDFHVAKEYRGRGIGTALQLAAIADYQKVILISEEENRAMYEHQGYTEVSWYWTVLKSNNRSYKGEEE
ncbi:GNAT family N-acetyltransferase [Streptococcus ovis]|uniref:GNAT family N-acetyltransferase n=1 Tax=Streptococcus ovis TaxID=82806 RepID=UPI0003667C04|nr:GNAT family N-acetyltransferase [Streptococcus ovis]